MESNSVDESSICLIMSMITISIRRHEVLLPINHNFNKICEIKALFKSKKKKFQDFFANSEKKPFKHAMMVRTVQLLRHNAYYPIKLSY